ncbi:LacI family DNA-binding transcriptional regulator [Paenibacillus sp. LMG 31456]|uniref:LacI family DNA-binding transcriptional regulator n=1 Tax=Paenibacillus foliorum TaxID=2654974 RepID=A0A972H0U4_9BACL|nr:LacI family DNA-binding transcriptional regulator [Paenibacillus foliorum]NOU96495.1 LacI family DNA-binding transcriptional regulator [Paenibacillus foliorum]
MSSVKEVAERAGVSPATVSRVINNDPTVKPETRRKVQQIIELINYKPNQFAKNLRKQASKIIVMVLPTMNNPFFAGIARGAQAATYKNGYHIITGTTEFNKWQLDAYINLLRTNLADGIIFVSLHASKDVLGDVFNKYPVVLCNEYFEDLEVPCVTIDNHKAGYDAARELTSRGKKNIAYVTGTRKSSSGAGRLNGYKQALSEAGIDYNPHLVVKAKSVLEQIKDAINGIKEKGLEIDAILTNSDLQASYILKGIKDRTIFLPPDISLISFDGTFVSEITNPSLTTVAQPMYELGYKSVEMLIQKLQNKNHIQENVVHLPHQLIIRET